MYIIKNALMNIGRNKGRNILIGIIIFFLILSTTVSLIIHSTSQSIIEDYKNRFGSKVNITFDMEKALSGTDGLDLSSLNFDVLTSDQYIEFSKSEYLKSYALTGTVSTTLPNLKAVDEDASDEGNSNIIVQNGDDLPEDFVEPTIKLVSNTDPAGFSEFTEGTRKITEGRIFENENECIVSADFAKLNNLSVGDSFEVAVTNEESLTLTISGIYTDITSEYGNFPFKQALFNRRNEILTSFDTLTEGFGIDQMALDGEYTLKSPDLLSAFEKELREMGLKDTFKVTTDEDSYNRIVAPVVGLSKITITFMWLILALGGVILLIISTIAVRERKYEIGVLRAMGMKKGKLAFMLMSECLIITVICLSIGLTAGSVISQPIADTMIEEQVEIAKEETQTNPFGGSSSGFISVSSTSETSAEPLSEIDVSLTAGATLKIGLVAIIIALLTSSIGVISITKYEPMKILLNRN